MDTKRNLLPTATVDYGIAALAIAIDLASIFMARADKATALRGELRAVHMILGTLLFLGLAIRLWRWWRGEEPKVAPTLQPFVTAWIMALTALLCALLFLNPLFGAAYAWTNAMLPGQSGGHHVILDRSLWLFTGYFHAGIGSSLLLTKLLIVLTGGYTLLRYGKGPISAFPRGIGMLGFFGLSVSLFAISTFKSYERGPWVVGGFWLLCLAIWGVSRLIRRSSEEPALRSPTALPRAFAASSAMLIALIGLYGPYAMFRVKPFEGAPTVKASAGITSHAAPARTEILPPETPFERQVRAETYKWCTFCHTMNKGGAHIAGPNLYGIYGQRIASVPNFTYTEGLQARGERGEIWDGRALDAYLANPDAFAPGTTMVISSGNITDPRRRAAIITILKRETGAEVPPAPKK